MKRLLSSTVVMLAACGGATKADDVDEAKRQATQAMHGLSGARGVLEVFGVLPSYQCGPLTNLVPEAIPPMSVSLACSRLSTREGGVDFSFADEGCQVAGHDVRGTLGLDVAAGESRVDVSADFRGLRVDGQSLPVRVGAGVCGDEKRAWVTVEQLHVADTVFSLDARGGLRQGLPIIGSSTVLLDGTGSLQQADGVTDVTVEGLEYEVGDFAPKAGTMTLQRKNGQTVVVRFTEKLWKVGKAEVTIDGGAPVEIPVVR